MGDPRDGRAYKAAVHAMLATNDLCHLCGHHGAQTGDHITSIKDWIALHGTAEGVNNPTNLAPAHGTRGRILNRCPTCGLLCNQSRGARSLTPSPRSRNW
jgi:hypothetical protein